MDLNVLSILTLSVLAIEAQYLGQSSYGPQSQKDRYQGLQQQKESLPVRQYIPDQTNRYPAILSHKQGLSSDGKFNYAFATDHGLQQGETINPDGSRTGAYSYVDPSGKKISVKYTAGKDGFKVLEGDHIPKAPAPVAPVQQEAYSARPASYEGSKPASYEGSRPALYESSRPAAYENSEPSYPRYTAGSFLGGGSGSSGANSYYKNSFNPSPVTFRGSQNELGSGYNSFSSPKYGSSGIASVSAAAPYYNVQEDSGEASSGSKSYFPAAELKQYLASESDESEIRDPKKPHTFGSGYSFAFEG